MPEDHQTNRQLGELERQVVETRNQMIKTSNTVDGLVGQIRELAQWQHRQERVRLFGLAGAVVAVLAGALVALHFYHRAQLHRVRQRNDALERRQVARARDLRQLRQGQKLRATAEKEALAFYRLIRGDRPQAAIERYGRIADLPLSKTEAALFRDWVGRHRDQLAYAAYGAGMRAVGEKAYKQAVAEFRRCLSLLPAPPYAGSLHYYLGISHMRLGSNREAAEALHKALDGDAERLVSRETRFHLATVYEQLGQRAKARASYRQYVKRHPSTPYARVARRRLKALAD